jgi:hypothetical protein
MEYAEEDMLRGSGFQKHGANRSREFPNGSIDGEGGASESSLNRLNQVPSVHSKILRFQRLMFWVLLTRSALVTKAAAEFVYR